MTRPLYIQEEPQYPLQEAGWALQPVWRDFCDEKIPCAHWELNQTVQRVTILTMLSQHPKTDSYSNTLHMPLEKWRWPKFALQEEGFIWCIALRRICRLWGWNIKAWIPTWTPCNNTVLVDVYSGESIPTQACLFSRTTSGLYNFSFPKCHIMAELDKSHILFSHF